mmetsp:Transcript_21533/g.46066  ORF Transcript_21533/g.46066 Transcript_21533/m.46066 type:complete len:281 (-) Transcript_21533:1725-2567(-)
MSTNWSLPSVPTPVAMFTEVMFTVVITHVFRSCLPRSTPWDRSLSARRATASRHADSASSKDRTITETRPWTIVLPSTSVRISSLPPRQDPLSAPSAEPSPPPRRLSREFGRVSHRTISPSRSAEGVPARRSWSFSSRTSTTVMEKASLYRSVLWPAMVKSCRTAWTWTPCELIDGRFAESSSPSSAAASSQLTSPSSVRVLPLPPCPNASSITLNPSSELTNGSSSSEKTSCCDAPGENTRSYLKHAGDASSFKTSVSCVGIFIMEPPLLLGGHGLGRQ